ncbi:stage II sporulation protein M [bacterium]|nr:stage II sporulation protein M [bacterium]
MTRDQFIFRRQRDWRRFEILVAEAEQQRRVTLSGDQIAELSALYRALCFDLSLVQSRDWGTSLSRYLNGLVARGHNTLYRSRPGSLLAAIQFLMTGFPKLLRENAAYFLLALALFVLPGAASGTAVCFDTSLASRILSGGNQAMMETMYSESVADRSADDDMLEGRSMMAGFYVRNNVGISFRCFALGAFAGIGTIVVLVYNSVALGTVTGFLIGRGHGGNFFEFVIGHGSFELTAIVVSGAAGLVLGHAMVHPGRLSRRDALIERGLVSVKLAIGAAAMLFVAALIEAYWSPSPLISRDVKMIVGGLLWLLVITWLGFAGSTHLNRMTSAFREPDVRATESRSQSSAGGRSNAPAGEPSA